MMTEFHVRTKTFITRRSQLRFERVRGPGAKYTEMQGGRIVAFVFWGGGGSDLRRTTGHGSGVRRTAVAGGKRTITLRVADAGAEHDDPDAPCATDVAKVSGLV